MQLILSTIMVLFQRLNNWLIALWKENKLIVFVKILNDSFYFLSLVALFLLLEGLASASLAALLQARAAIALNFVN